MFSGWHAVLYAIPQQVALEVYTGQMAFDKQRENLTVVILKDSSCILSVITCIHTGIRALWGQAEDIGRIQAIAWWKNWPSERPAHIEVDIHANYRMPEATQPVSNLWICIICVCSIYFVQYILYSILSSAQVGHPVLDRIWTHRLGLHTHNLLPYRISKHLCLQLPPNHKSIYYYSWTSVTLICQYSLVVYCVCTISVIMMTSLFTCIYSPLSSSYILL